MSEMRRRRLAMMLRRPLKSSSPERTVPLVEIPKLREVQMPWQRYLLRCSGVLILLASSTAFVLPAMAATINGTLTLTPEFGQHAEKVAQKRAGSLKQFYWRVPNGAVPTIGARLDPSKDLAVVIERTEGQATAPEGTIEVVKLQGARLAPSVVVVTPHTSVRFQNDDAIVYELQCAENGQLANGQIVPPGRAAEVPFDSEGIFTITDRRLPHIIGYVVVVGSALSANPRRGEKAGQAAFSFEDVSPGQYTVKVFFGGDWVIQQPLEVTDTEEIGVQIRLPSDEQQHQGEDGDAAPQEAQ